MISIEASKSRSARILAATAATLLFSTVASAHEGDHWPISVDQVKARWSNSPSQVRFQATPA
jgi:hypothetical protein